MAGVKVKKGQDEVEVLAPVVVSNCGVFTTFQKLLPPEVSMRAGGRATCPGKVLSHAPADSLCTLCLLQISRRG